MYYKGFVETIPDEGMPIFEGTGFGDLYIEYNVVLPNKLSPDLRKRSCPLVIFFFSFEHLLDPPGLITALQPMRKPDKTEL